MLTEILKVHFRWKKGPKTGMSDE